MEIKYTTDGKKVVVLGSLNSDTKIVQEIFIVNGQEIPSGENFTAKGLHDQPAKSWKQKAIEDWDKRYEEKKKEFDENVKKLNGERNAVTTALDYYKNLNKSFSEGNQQLNDVFERTRKLLSGEYKYFIKMYGYSTITEDIIKDFDFHNFADDDGFERLKLISLFGNSRGDIGWRIHQYYDHSGSSYETHFFETKEEAITFCIKECQKRAEQIGRYEQHTAKFLLEHGVSLVKEYVDKFVEFENANVEYFEKSKDEAHGKLEKQKKDLEFAKSLLGNV